jgi:hypothetical protein
MTAMHGPAEISLRREAFAGQKMMSTPTVFKGWGRQRPDMPYMRPMAREESAMNDNEQRPVTIITGRVWRKKGGRSEGVHILLVAPDDDTAVRTALEALTREGYAEAELDQIGDMEGVPDDEPHLSAYQGALEGEVSIVTFDEPI